MRTNLVTNPSFEYDLSGITGATYVNYTRITTGGYAGNSFLRGSVASQGTNLLMFMNNIAVPNATQVTFSAYVRSTSGRTIVIGSNTGATGSSSIVSNGTWQRVSHTTTTTATSCNIYFQVSGYVAGDVLDVDAVLFETGSTAGSYFDGSTALTAHTIHGWNGNVHNSTSYASTIVRGGYYKDITLALPDYGDDLVTKLLIGVDSSVSGANFHINARGGFPTGKNDGGNLAFADAETGQVYPFWVESVSNGLATVWVHIAKNLKSPYNLASGTVVRCWYGNPGNTGFSNGNATFRFFDDFSTSTIDPTKWSVSGGSAGDSISSANNELAVISDGTSPIKTIQSIGISSEQSGIDSMSVHYRQRTTTMGNHNLGVGIMGVNQADGNGQFFFRHVNPSTGNGDINAYSRSSGAWSLNFQSQAVWTYAEGATNWIHEMNGSTHKLYKGATQIGSNVTKTVGSGPLGSPRTAYIIMNRVWNEATIDTGTFYYDWVFAKAPSTPTFSSASSEVVTGTKYWVGGSGAWNGNTATADSFEYGTYQASGWKLSAGEMYGNSFTGNGSKAYQAQFRIKRVGTLTGNAYARIYAHTGTYGAGGKPTGSYLAQSSAVSLSGISTTRNWYGFTFSGNNAINLASGTKYTVVVYTESGDATNYIEVGDATTGGVTNGHPGNVVYYTGGTWYGDSTWDVPFRLFTQSTNWSYTSGGTPNAPVPTGSEYVVFDQNSFTAAGQTVSGAGSSVKGLDWTNVTNNPTWSLSYNNIDTYGSFKLSPNMTVTGVWELDCQVSAESSPVIDFAGHKLSALYVYDDYAFPSGVDFVNDPEGAWETYVTLSAQNTLYFPHMSFTIATSADGVTVRRHIEFYGRSVPAGTPIAEIDSFTTNRGPEMYLDSSIIKINSFSIGATASERGYLYGRTAGAQATLLSDSPAVTLSHLLVRDMNGGGSTSWTADYSADISNNTNITFTNAMASARFSATPLSGYIPLEVLFTDESVGVVSSWLWDFGDGTTSTLQNPTHTYTTAGTWTVTLTVNGANGGTATTKTSYIVSAVEPPAANFTATPQSGPFPLTVNFTDTSSPAATSWLWNFGDSPGGPSTRTYDFENQIISDFVMSGNAGWAINSTQKATGTYSLKSGTITDNQTSEASLSVDLAVSGDVTFSYFVSSESGYDYLTFYIDGVNTASWSGNSGWVTPAAYPLTSGAHTLKWVYSKDGSVAEGSDAAWIDNIIITGLNSSTTSDEQNPTFTYTEEGSYTVTLIASNAGGSTSTSKTVTVYKPAPVASFTASPLSGPSPLNVSFTDTSSYSPLSWLWDFGDGTTSTLQNPTHEYTQLGAYTVTLSATNETGTGTVTQTDLITVTEKPTVVLVSAQSSATTGSLSGEVTNAGSGTILQAGAIVGTKPFNATHRLSYPDLDLGIETGVVSTDLKMVLDTYNNVANPGEIYFTGTQFTKRDGTVVSVPSLNSGIALIENLASVRYAFIMYSATSVFTRFSASPPDAGNANHLIAVYWNGTSWQYDNNTTLVNFTPVASDVIIAVVTYGLAAGVSQASFIYAATALPQLGSFTVNFNNLSPKTTYYTLPYATNSAGTAYGSEVDFQTGTTSSSDLKPAFNLMFLP